MSSERPTAKIPPPPMRLRKLLTLDVTALRPVDVDAIKALLESLKKGTEHE